MYICMYIKPGKKSNRRDGKQKKTLGFLANFSFHILVDLCKFNVVFAKHNT